MIFHNFLFNFYTFFVAECTNGNKRNCELLRTTYNLMCSYSADVKFMKIMRFSVSCQDFVIPITLPHRNETTTALRAEKMCPILENYCLKNIHILYKTRGIKTLAKLFPFYPTLENSTRRKHYSRFMFKMVA